MANTTTCRDAVLDAMRALERRHGRKDFILAEIVKEVQSQTNAFAESTIRTNVVSRMCTNAPDNHPVVYHDLVRVAEIPLN